jgi:ketosteroid isomerase-like protein
MIRTPTSLALALAAAVAACTPAPAPTADTAEADAAAIRTVSADWIAAYNAADADVIMLAPDRQPLMGPEAVVQRHREFFDEFSATQTSTVDEVTVFGDVAFARGTWNTRQTPKAGGAEQVRNGKWMELYRRQPDGSWKTWRWMWTEDRSSAQEPGS